MKENLGIDEKKFTAWPTIPYRRRIELLYHSVEMALKN